MEKTLSEILGKAPIDGEFGIEVECEGKNLKLMEGKYWATEHDGSLRGIYPDTCCEWILKKPLSLDKTTLAIKHLYNEQTKNGAEFNFSFRTSVHVHVNVLDLTWTQYCNFIYLYLLVEEPLMRFCGNERIGNRFCLRLQDAEGLMDTLSFMFKSGPNSLRHVIEDEVRYAALNVAATRKYGSLEFRGMRGNLDVNVLTTWINTLHALKQAAIKWESPKEIAEWARNTRNSEVCMELIGEFFLYPDIDSDMNTSFSLSYELPYVFLENKEVKRDGHQEIFLQAFAANPIDRLLDVRVNALRRAVGIRDDLIIADEGVE